MARLDRFHRLRQKVMQEIAEQLEYDPACKSYEGAFEWTVCYPSYFDDATGAAKPAAYILTLHCYVLGPGRHYNWCGKTMDEALDKAEKDIAQWIGESDDD